MQQKENKKILLNYILNILIIILLMLSGYFVYSLFDNSTKKGKITKEITDTSKSNTQEIKKNSISIEVLNGTGETGIAAIFREFLQQKEFDVIKMDNYTSSTEEKTIIIDRRSNIKKAKLVAEALGAKESQVTQITNPTLQIDVTVIIGKDYNELKPIKAK